MSLDEGALVLLPGDDDIDSDEERADAIASRKRRAESEDMPCKKPRLVAPLASIPAMLPESQASPMPAQESEAWPMPARECVPSSAQEKLGGPLEGKIQKAQVVNAIRGAPPRLTLQDEFYLFKQLCLERHMSASQC